MDELRFTIPLKPVTKKNSEVRTKSGGVIPSKAYRRYEKDAAMLIPHWARRHIDKAVNVQAVYYCPINYYAPGCKARIDITNLHNALHDTLVAAGVIADDNCRIVYSTDGSRVRYDKKNPRTEVIITEAEP